MQRTLASQQSFDGPISRINTEEFDCFKKGINLQKIDQLRNTLENQDITHTCETINQAVEDLCNIFRESADIVKASRKPKNHSTKPMDKPWFGAQCKTARRNYFLAKRIHRRQRTEDSHLSLVQMSKMYKRVMNMHINKYKKSQHQVLRRMQSSEPKKYWKYINSLKSKQKADAPSADTFYEFFKEVYSAENVSADDEIPLNFNFEHSNAELNRPFTEAEIYSCIRKLKNSKSPGHDNILNEFIKVTKVEMTPIYVSLFNIILNTGIIPDEWSVGKIRPIYKNKGSTTDPNNYRPITILSCLNKLFTAVLNERLTEYLDENVMLSENQAGFRKTYSTSDHIFSLHALIEIMKFEKKKLFCSFVDFSKAFDSVWRSALWGKLLCNEINGNFLRVLHNIYLNAKSFISINNQESGFLVNGCGLRQGDNISPILFSMYLNDLETYFDANRINGVPVEFRADDMFRFEDCKMLEIIQNNFLRSLVNFRKSTPLYMVLGEFGRYPLELAIKSRMIGFWVRILTNKPTKLSYILYRKLIETPDLNPKWVTKIKQILDECGMSEVWLSQTPPRNLAKTVTEILQNQFFQSWGSGTQRIV